MVRECSNALIEIVNEMQTTIKKQLDLLKQNQGNYEISARIQQGIIDFGNELEHNFHLEKSPFIENLQNCCELIYAYNLSGGDQNIELLQDTIEDWQKALKKSITVWDRKLSLAVIIRDEAAYIEEWIEFHFAVGVSHIYIYDNESTDNIKEKLQKYIDSGQVTYIWFPGQARQLPAYNHAIEHFKYDTVYMGFIDADEFLVPVQDKSLVPALERAFDTGAKCAAKIGAQCGGIGVNWRLYGTSGHVKKPEGLVIENYIYRAKNDYQENAHIKTICNPRTVKAFVYNPHSAVYLDHYCCTSENGSYIPFAFFYDGACKYLRINHYYSKSESELRQRMLKGKASETGSIIPAENKIKKRLQEVIDHMNEVYDPIMEKYVPIVNKMLGK